MTKDIGFPNSFDFEIMKLESLYIEIPGKLNNYTRK